MNSYIALRALEAAGLSCTEAQAEALRQIAERGFWPNRALDRRVVRNLLRAELVEPFWYRGLRHLEDCLRLTRRGMAAVDRANLWPYVAEVDSDMGCRQVGSAPHPRVAAELLWNPALAAGLYQSDMSGHLRDLALGHAVMAEDGTTFRVRQATA
ncbi:hypothetical protein [Streptomyces sp. MP131-18]|uniref:hypothetical protein n=1 Tax=Streptomyces sp. MP131-18 TaxID=1857892 RepID=UPI00097C636E|nr:hypothetical protein [Streptomyces sp. MP131-18]ONK10393.1 hypothetical protein STBA_11150 [Streptomyces sp. MP131-18]